MIARIPFQRDGMLRQQPIRGERSASSAPPSNGTFPNTGGASQGLKSLFQSFT